LCYIGGLLLPGRLFAYTSLLCLLALFNFCSARYTCLVCLRESVPFACLYIYIYIYMIIIIIIIIIIPRWTSWKVSHMTGVAYVRRRGDHPPTSGLSGIIWVERTRNSCPLSVKKENRSRHLVF
jgi:hypothetical protein